MTNYVGNTWEYKKSLWGISICTCVSKTNVNWKISMGMPGNTGKIAIEMSEHVLTYQKNEWYNKSGWEYLGIPKQYFKGIRTCTYLSKTCVSRKIGWE